MLFDDREPCASPKLLTLLPISVDQAMAFNSMWHSRLPNTVKGNMLRNRTVMFYGAFYKNNFYAVGMWTTPVAANRMTDGQNWLELRRLAIAPDAPKFTATWMLSRMIKDIKKRFPLIHSLVSYQDTEVHSGTIYAAGNWVCDSETKYIPWSSEARVRKATVQSDAPKKRWVYYLRKRNEKNPS